MLYCGAVLKYHKQSNLLNTHSFKPDVCTSMGLQEGFDWGLSLSLHEDGRVVYLSLSIINNYISNVSRVPNENRNRREDVN